MLGVLAGVALIGGAALLEQVVRGAPIRRNPKRRRPHTSYLVDALASGYYQRAILRWRGSSTEKVDRDIESARRRLLAQGLTPIELRVLEADLAEETRALGHLGVKKNARRWTSHRMKRNGLTVIEERSPLKYHHSTPVLRLSVVDSDAPLPSSSATYFAEVKVGAPGRRKVKMPGASPGVVAWLDYHLTHGYGETGRGVYIDYVRTRDDQTQRGHLKRLLEALMAKYPGDDVDFGDIVSKHVEKVWFRMKAAPGPRRIYGKIR